MEAKKTLTKTKTYLVSWYGPFHSVEEMREWQCRQDIDFRLYLLQGKKPRGKVYYYYCGQTARIPKRLKDNGHHICEIPNSRNIWIGAFEGRCRYSKKDINIVENMFIYLLTEKVRYLNRQSLRFSPKDYDYNVFFISRWYNPNHNRQPDYSIKLVLPEVVAYSPDTGEVKIARKLHSL